MNWATRELSGDTFLSSLATRADGCSLGRSAYNNSPVNYTHPELLVETPSVDDNCLRSVLGKWATSSCTASDTYAVCVLPSLPASPHSNSSNATISGLRTSATTTPSVGFNTTALPCNDSCGNGWFRLRDSCYSIGTHVLSATAAQTECNHFPSPTSLLVSP